LYVKRRAYIIRAAEEIGRNGNARKATGCQMRRKI